MMNDYSFDEIEVGHVERFQATVDQNKMTMFADITGDYNPRHTERKVVYGMLTASFLSTLAGMYLPGKGALVLGVNVEMPKPHNVSEGESVITVTGEVIEKVNVLQMLTLKVRITDANGKTLLRGSMKVKVTEDVK